MTAKDLLRHSIEFGHRVARGFMEDLTDADLLVRSVPRANNIAWPLGHSFTSTRRLRRRGMTLGWQLYCRPSAVEN